MAFSSIDQSVINGIFIPRSGFGQKVKDNFDNHESRIAGLESAIAHARYVRTAALSTAWSGDKQMSFPTMRKSHPAITPVGTDNLAFLLEPGLWRLCAGARAAATCQVSIATGQTWSVNNVIAAGSGASLNDNVALDIDFDVQTAVCVNVYNGASGNISTGFGDATFISMTRQAA
ncbi:hypothetical protein [Amycolatopsis thermoflava]|uniref:hypothetical protein n=1 Tax=Amycolatopsis thermoflava TaxID=84480 RepID=UPI00382425B0